ncbi:hypothetical protein [Paenibacillus sp. NPDC058071]
MNLFTLEVDSRAQEYLISIADEGAKYIGALRPFFSNIGVKVDKEDYR